MHTKIRTCALCGKQYEYCGHCEKDAATPWKNLFHSEACRDLFDLAAKYREKAITLDEAKKAYKALDVSDINIANIKGVFKPFINEIAKSNIVVPKPITDEKVEAKPAEPAPAETTIASESKKIFSKKN